MDVLSCPISATGTWEREAQRVSVLAADLGLPLDPEQLILSDVRDLVALRLRLQASRSRARRHHSGWAL
jgi:hypothetical protein